MASGRMATLKEQLTAHPVYAAVATPADLRCFMEHHVYAVWDFMSLLKALQGAVAPAQTPWLPSPQPELRRFINEIVLGEECDEYLPGGPGKFISHYELYLLAMEEVGADTGPVRRFVAAVAAEGLAAALLRSEVPAPAREFMRSTFAVIASGQAPAVAAAFTYGREDLIPAMFGALLERMQITEAMAPHFHYYLNRHTELDGETHGPLALQLVGALCAGEAAREQAAVTAAEQALAARIELWDGVVAAMRKG